MAKFLLMVVLVSYNKLLIMCLLDPTFLVGCFDLQVTKSSVMCYGMHIPYQETNCSLYLKISQAVKILINMYYAWYAYSVPYYVQLYNTMQN